MLRAALVISHSLCVDVCREAVVLFLMKILFNITSSLLIKEISRHKYVKTTCSTVSTRIKEMAG